MEVLKVMEEEELQKNALDTGDHFTGLLEQLKGEFPEIGDVRGSGLFLGVEFIENDNLDPATWLAAALKNELRNRHILVSTDGPWENVIKMKPPLCFNKENADRVAGEMREILRVLRS